MTQEFTFQWSASSGKHKALINDNGIQFRGETYLWKDIDGIAFGTSVRRMFIFVPVNHSFGLWLRHRDKHSSMMDLSTTTAVGIGLEKARTTYKTVLDIVIEKAHKPLLEAWKAHLAAGKRIDFGKVMNGVHVILTDEGIELHKRQKKEVILWKNASAGIGMGQIAYLSDTSNKSRTASFLTRYWNAALLGEYILWRQGKAAQ